MGEPVPGMQAAEDVAAESLLSAFKDIAAPERRRHASVINYWLSIRGSRPFPPIRDLDPLEISDAGPCSLLLEMIGGGEDADIRHLGQAIKAGVEAERISAAPNPSLLSCIAGKLPIVAATRQAFAFEDAFPAADGTTRCWVTLLPFSSTGTWIDFVYGFVSLDPGVRAGEEIAEPPADELLPQSEPDPQPEECAFEVQAAEAPEGEREPEPELEARSDLEPEPELVAADEADGATAQAGDADFDAEAPLELATPAAPRPGVSGRMVKPLEGEAGYYGNHVTVDFEPPAGPSQEAQPEAAEWPMEDALQSKLAEVRAKAEEAREARRRSNLALIEGLGAAYDFALDAEEHPEDYLKLVEAQGLKIQLRSPMTPVVKLAFNGLCEESTIAQLEAVLAWALKNDFPRGSLAERIEAEGGIGAVLDGLDRAA